MSDKPIIYTTKFRYATAAESAKPNYLKNKFDRIRREMREKAEQEAAKPKAIVRTIAKGKP